MPCRSWGTPNSACASNAPLQEKRQPASWAALGGSSPAGRRRWSFSFTQYWWDTSGLLCPALLSVSWCLPSSNSSPLTVVLGSFSVTYTYTQLDFHQHFCSLGWRDYHLGRVKKPRHKKPRPLCKKAFLPLRKGHRLLCINGIDRENLQPKKTATTVMKPDVSEH